MNKPKRNAFKSGLTSIATVLPSSMCKELGITENTRLEFERKGKKIVVSVAKED